MQQVFSSGNENCYLYSLFLLIDAFKVSMIANSNFQLGKLTESFISINFTEWETLGSVFCGAVNFSRKYFPLQIDNKKNIEWSLKRHEKRKTVEILREHKKREQIFSFRRFFLPPLSCYYFLPVQIRESTQKPRKMFWNHFNLPEISHCLSPRDDIFTSILSVICVGVSGLLLGYVVFKAIFEVVNSRLVLFDISTKREKGKLLKKLMMSNWEK